MAVTYTSSSGRISIDYVSKEGNFDYSNFDEVNRTFKRERARGIAEGYAKLKDLVRQAEKWERDGVNPDGLKLLEEAERAQHGF